MVNPEHIVRSFNTLWIYTALKLYFQITKQFRSFNTLWIYTALKRHLPLLKVWFCFNTLWIYTALKLCSIVKNIVPVSIPSEFTLLSNFSHLMPGLNRVSIPSEFTLLSNFASEKIGVIRFQYPLNLHCSQTHILHTLKYNCFNTLWIYTALKPLEWYLCRALGFNTLWIYTALKPNSSMVIPSLCFNTLWIYTALKLLTTVSRYILVSIPSEFTLLSNG